jgi:hypothetical protein
MSYTRDDDEYRMIYDQEYFDREDALNIGSYNKNGKYMLYRIETNNRIATIKKVGNLDGVVIEEIINDFLFNQYKRDYITAMVEVRAYLTNPNYIQESVNSYIEDLLSEGNINNLDEVVNRHIISLQERIQKKIAFLKTSFVPKPFNEIVCKYNLPFLLKCDEDELFNTYFYENIDFIITYDPIIQT